MRLFRRKKKQKTEWYQEQLGLNGFSYENDDIIDGLLEKCIPYGIRTLNVDTHYMTILFRNDIEYHFWNKNRYYAWMSSGHFKDVQNSKLIYSWSEGVPTAKNMWIVKTLIREWYGEFIEEKDISVIYDTLEKFAPKNTVTWKP